MISKLQEAGRTQTEPRPIEPKPAEPRRELARAAEPRSRWWIKPLVLCVLGATASFAYPYLHPYVMQVYPKVKAWIPTGAPPPAAPKGPRVVPVVTATARQGDMNLFLTALGTVTAENTVTIKSRVDGELVSVLFTEGQMVKKGDILAEIDRRPFQAQLSQAEGQLTKDEAALKVAQLDYDRYKALAASRSITAQQVDAQLALVKQSEGAIQADKGQIDTIKLQLTYCRIIAPISGRIGLRIVDQGNIVHANDPTGLAVITQLQPISVIFTIPQDEIARVQRRSVAGEPLVVGAFDRAFEDQLASGKLSAIDNQVDATTGTLRLKAEFANEQGLLFPNQFVNVRLLVDTLRGATLVPNAAVQRGPDSTFVYVIKPDETAELRKIEEGQTDGDSTAITSGIAPGDVVVIDGVDKLLPGAKVAVRKPPGTKPEQAGPGQPSGEKGT